MSQFVICSKLPAASQDAHSGVGDQQITGFFQQGDSLFPADRREILEKIIQRVAAFQVINQRASGNTRAGKARRAAHDFRVDFDDGVRLHARN
jgi:hypothetical protein